MFYKRFKKDSKKCIEVETVTVNDVNENPVAFIQLTTDGTIYGQEERTVRNIYGLNLLPMEKYYQENKKIILKRTKIYNPSYYMLSSYILKDDTWSLFDRESFISSGRGVLYELNYIANMPQDSYLSKEEPAHERDKVKVKFNANLKRQN